MNTGCALVCPSLQQQSEEVISQKRRSTVCIACSAIYTALCLLFLNLLSCHLRSGEVTLIWVSFCSSCMFLQSPRNLPPAVRLHLHYIKGTLLTLCRIWQNHVNQEKEKGKEKAQDAGADVQRYARAGCGMLMSACWCCRCDFAVSYANAGGKSHSVVSVARPQNAQRALPTAHSGSESTV